ncbi:MAG TPA: hypothetical protein VEA59_00600 [Patescibacteria group bacterium]|nr:hypothetical protein [Patescibacteria group bacterium]
MEVRLIKRLMGHGHFMNCAWHKDHIRGFWFWDFEPVAHEVGVFVMPRQYRPCWDFAYVRNKSNGDYEVLASVRAYCSPECATQAAQHAGHQILTQ